MKYAVVKIQGTQYKITEGEELLVDSLKEKKLTSEVLLNVNEDEVQVGKPVLDKVKVDFEILGEEKGKKLYVSKYKAKSRYRRKLGFRSQLTRLKVKKIV